MSAWDRYSLQQRGRTEIMKVSFCIIHNRRIESNRMSLLQKRVEANRFGSEFLKSWSNRIEPNWKSVRIESFWIRIFQFVSGSDPDASRRPLEKLHISFHKAITDESMKALLEILEKNETLKIICLQNCGLSERARRRSRHMAAKKKKRKFNLTE